MSHRHDTGAFVKKLRRLGYDVAQHKSHYTVRDASGRRVTTFGSTPSDYRWRENALARIRKHPVDKEPE